MAYERPIPNDLDGLLERDEIISLQNEFLDEAAEDLQSVMNLLASVEHTTIDQNALHKLFRSVHSIKGSACVFGYDDLSRISHTVESCLAPYRGLPKESIPAHTDSILLLVGVLLRLVRDGRADRMDCPAAERELTQLGKALEPTRVAMVEHPRPNVRSTINNAAVAQSAQPLHLSGTAAALILDSSHTFPQLLQRFLEPYQVDCIHCHDGAEVIEHCVLETPVLLFLGHILPDMTTTDLLAMLHETGTTPRVIVLVSSREEVELREACPYPFIYIRKDHQTMQALDTVMKTLFEE